MSYRKWVITFLLLLMAGFLLIGGLVALVDPYFHYHSPLPGLSYHLFFQRYQNDGIVKHFDYTAIITGNSMSENFKTSECDALFGVDSIKVPYSGASPKELDMNLRTALRCNDAIRMVIMPLDYGNFSQDKDYMSYDDADYPDYLYDDNPFNDVKYLYNKNILSTTLSFLSRTLSGQPATSFDAYSAWDSSTPYSRELVFASHERHWDNPEISTLDQERRELLRGNIEQNLLETARAYPNVDFYYYFPPFSILFWDKQERMGVLEMQLDAEREAVNMLLAQENIHLFSFMDNFDLICDFTNYKDYIHHSPAVNSLILQWLADGTGELTTENYEAYHQRLRAFVTSFDYDSLYE